MRFFLFLFCLGVVLPLGAQGPDFPAAVSDSLPVPDRSPGFLKRVFTKNYPNPKTALLLSFALPGAGQAYNRKWWKVPVVYAVLGGLVYVQIDNIQEYRRLRDNYKLLVDGDPDTNPVEEPYSLIDATSMKQYRDQWRRYVEQSTVAVGLAYILTATEAYVNAHLSQFDVSDDLSLRVQPRFQANPGTGITFGLGATLQFGGTRSKTVFASP